jgi:hypothetical protein
MKAKNNPKIRVTVKIPSLVDSASAIQLEDFVRALPAIQQVKAEWQKHRLVIHCTGKPYARFDEGGQVNVTMIKLWRHRQTKGAATDRFDLRCGKPVFYSTLEILLD